MLDNHSSTELCPQSDNLILLKVFDSILLRFILLQGDIFWKALLAFCPTLDTITNGKNHGSYLHVAFHKITPLRNSLRPSL